MFLKKKFKLTFYSSYENPNYTFTPTLSLISCRNNKKVIKITICLVSITLNVGNQANEFCI